MNVRPEDARGARRPGPSAVSSRRYAVRRAVALVVVSLLIVGVVKGVGALFGGGGERLNSAQIGPRATSAGEPDGAESVASSSLADAEAPELRPDPDPDPSPDAAVAAAPAPPAAAPVTSAPVAAVPPTSAAPSSDPPSATDPARVLVVGDSNGGTFGPYLKTLLDETGIVDTTVDYKVSSGLARPDFFDWYAHLQATLPTAQPDIVVITFGGNDTQGIALHDGTFPEEWNDPIADDAAWSAEYERRALEILDLLAEGGSSIIWVGIPNDESDQLTARLAVQDTAAKAAVAARPDVVFVDTWARFSGRNGGWAEFVVDPRDGIGKDVRSDVDGFHLNENGAEILAIDIADVVRAELAARGAQL